MKEKLTEMEKRNLDSLAIDHLLDIIRFPQKGIRSIAMKVYSREERLRLVREVENDPGFVSSITTYQFGLVLTLCEEIMIPIIKYCD